MEKNTAFLQEIHFFLGDVGIPDVAQRYAGVSKEELAGLLHDSIIIE